MPALPMVPTVRPRSNGVPADQAEGGNPNRMVRDDKAGQSWIDDVPGERERRAKIALPFVHLTDHGEGIVTAHEHAGGLEEMLARGLVEIEPFGDRVMLRGIMPEDASATKIKQPEYDGRRAVIHEVLALGPGARAAFTEKGYTDENMPKVGELFFVLSTMTDRLAAKNKMVRIVTIPAKFLGARVRLVKPPVKDVNAKP